MNNHGHGDTRIRTRQRHIKEIRVCVNLTQQVEVLRATLYFAMEMYTCNITREKTGERGNLTESRRRLLLYRVHRRRRIW